MPRLLPGALLAIAAATAAGCAVVPAGPPSAPPEHSFRGVKSVALVHRLGGGRGAPTVGEARRRDPLDALQSALAGRGVRTVDVELVDPVPAELEPVDRAAAAAEWGAEGARPGFDAPGVFTVGERARLLLDRLGADAFAVFVREQGFGGMPPPRALVGPSYAGAPPGGAAGPASWLAVVARDGTAIAWSWGARSSPFGAGPANAAEAIEAALAVLVQDPAE